MSDPYCNHHVRAIQWIDSTEAIPGVSTYKKVCCVICGMMMESIRVTLDDDFPDNMDLGLAYSNYYYSADLGRWIINCDKYWGTTHDKRK